MSPPARRGGCWDDATRGGDAGSSGRLLLPREEGLISDSDAARRCLGLRLSGLPWNTNEPPFISNSNEGMRKTSGMAALSLRCHSAVFMPAMLTLLASLLAIALAPLAVISLYDSKGETR